MLKRLLLLIALLAVSGCDHWMEKLAPTETAFARHCFDLLQHRDFPALDALAAPSLRTAGFAAHLSEMAALIPAEAPISSDAANFDVSTSNGYTTGTVGMVYQFPTIWLEFDIRAEGSGDTLALTAISLRPTEARTPLAIMPVLTALPFIVFVLALIGAIAYRRRTARREALQTPLVTLERRSMWSSVLDDVGTRTPWFYRLLGVRRIDLTSPLGPEACKARLQESIGSESMLFRWGKTPRRDFQGRVGASGFRIFRNRPFLQASRYPTFLYGSLAADGVGTRLRCSLGPQRLLLGLAGVFLFFIWVAIPTVGISHQGFHSFTLLVFLGPLVMTAFIAGGFALRRSRAREDGAVLLDFLSQTLDATEAPPPRLGSVERAVQR